MESQIHVPSRRSHSEHRHVMVLKNCARAVDVVRPCPAKRGFVVSSPWLCSGYLNGDDS